jgi:hypothetical protein
MAAARVLFDIYIGKIADVAELADALDLGSSGVTRGGSTPSIRTRTFECAPCSRGCRMRRKGVSLNGQPILSYRA